MIFKKLQKRIRRDVELQQHSCIKRKLTAEESEKINMLSSAYVISNEMEITFLELIMIIIQIK